MALVHYHDSESEDDDSVLTPVDKMPPGVVSSGLGIPPSRPKPESENVDVVLHKPVVQAAPALSLVDYGHEPDAQEEEEVPDLDEKAEPGISDVISLLEDKENSQDEMVEETLPQERQRRRSFRPHTCSLPPPPAKPCAPEEQERIIQWLAAKRRTGKSLNQNIQQRKDFRNPSIYEKLIQYCGIDEFGTNLSADVFDPHEWGEESYYEELSKAQREHEAKKQKEKLAQQKTQVEIVTATKSSQPPPPPAPPPAAAAAVAAAASSSSGVALEKKRKSKWDQSGPGSTGSSPKQRMPQAGVGVQALLNAQLQAEMQKLLKK